MDLTDFVGVIHRRWRIVTTGLVLGVASAIGFLALATPMYSSTSAAYVSITSTDSQSAGEISQGSTAAQAKVRSYVDIVTSPLVLQPVIDKLHLKTTVEELAKRVSAKSKIDTVVIQITARDTSPARARDIAAAVDSSFRTKVENILDRSSSTSASPVSITNVAPASTPNSASSPDRLKVLGGGIAAGLILGMIAAVSRETLDTRLRSRHDVEELVSTPILGSIAYDGEAKKNALVTVNDHLSPRSESYRSLRTNLQFVTQTAATRSIVVTSAEPGEGKSTTAANLAIAMAESGARILLIDGDLRRPRAAELFGLEGAAGLTDVLIGRAEISDVLQTWQGMIDILPAGQIPPNPSELLGSMAMSTLLDEVTAHYDYVLVDAPPLLSVTDATILTKSCSGALVVTALGRAHRSTLRDALASLDTVGGRTLGILLNMAKPQRRDAYAYARPTSRRSRPLVRRHPIR